MGTGVRLRLLINTSPSASGFLRDRGFVNSTAPSGSVSVTVSRERAVAKIQNYRIVAVYHHLKYELILSTRVSRRGR
jgi:hypothetical protein